MPDYFYGPQAEQFAFYRIPKALFTDPAFRSISTDAKVLYGLLLYRMSLSARNDWLDEQGRVYIVFTVRKSWKVSRAATRRRSGFCVNLKQKLASLSANVRDLASPT